MADGDVPADKPAGGSGSGWGGGFAVLIVIGAAVKFFGGGKADKPAPLPPNNAPPAVVAAAPPVGPAFTPVGQGDPWSAALQAAPARRRTPQETLGWNRSQCMFCKKQRNRQEAGQFSDSDGFGFCAECGSCANAFAIHRANFDQGFGSDQRTEQLAKVYLESIGNRYPLHMAAFMQWGNDRAWREAWHNFAVLTVPGYSEGR